MTSTSELSWAGSWPGTAGLLFCALLSTTASAETLLRFEGFSASELHAAGFEIRRPARIRVDAVGVRVGQSRELHAYAWILDGATREPVWIMDSRGSERVDGEPLLRQARETLELAPGRYELYAFASPFWRLHGDWRFGSLRNLRFWFADGRWGNRAERDYERALDDCRVELSSEELGRGDLGTFEPTGEIPGALVQRNRLGDGEVVRAAFRLDQPMDVEIYALAEYPEDWDHPSDHGWIVEADTRERVWEIDDRSDTEHAGGDEKNRRFRHVVRLEKGDYELTFGTDDSHSYERFNANPPYDPPNWGITLLPGAGSDVSGFHAIEPPARKPLLELTRAREEETLEQPFRLQRDAELWIYALGEYAHREFADHGWIQKAGTSEIVWEMTGRNTHHAGGAEKNRLFDGRVRLPAGNYVAYYVTDDSHSYRDWNADFDRDAWGLTLYAGPGMRAEDFETVAMAELPEDPNVLVRITGVRDDESLSERLTLDVPTRVRIYALGEGSDGTMYDYGTIEDVESGAIVWEMTWRNSRHAGGAKKNRVFDGEVLLDAGTYEVRYETDDSHSFGDWNDRPPRDPHGWGITVSVAAR
jgi:hypothetical protein